MSHSACSRLLITVTSDYKLADLYQVFSTWVVWTLMAPSVLVFPLSDTHKSQIKHWIPFRGSIFLNTQSVAMLCHTVHHGIRAMHDSPIWFYIEMLSHDWSKWEQAEFTDKKKHVREKLGQILINAFFVITNAWRDIHVYILSLYSRRLYVAEKSDLFTAVLSTQVPWRSCSRGHTKFRVFVSVQREHPHCGLSCCKTLRNGDIKFKIYYKVFSERLSLLITHNKVLWCLCMRDP